MKLPGLSQITYAFAILGFLYSVIVRRRNRATKEELTIHIEAAFAGLTVPSAVYLIACGFYPELLTKIPGYQYYVGIGGLAALFFAVYKLIFVIPPKEGEAEAPRKRSRKSKTGA
jgi:hypothetical protein